MPIVLSEKLSRIADQLEEFVLPEHTSLDAFFKWNDVHASIFLALGQPILYVRPPNGKLNGAKVVRPIPTLIRKITFGEKMRMVQAPIPQPLKNLSIAKKLIPPGLAWSVGDIENEAFAHIEGYRKVVAINQEFALTAAALRARAKTEISHIADI